MNHLDPEHFTCMKPINVNDHLCKLLEEVDEFEASSNVQTNDEHDILGVEVSEEQLTILKNTCNPSSLAHEDEIPQTSNKQQLWATMEFVSKSDAGGHLQTVKIREHWAKSYNDKNNVFSFPLARNLDSTDHEDLVPRKDALAIVRLYFPFVSGAPSKRHPRHTHEIAILTSQTLSELRDQFKCVHDYAATFEIQHPDDDVATNQNKDRYPSGFIYIENCFYNDMRHPDAIEYSKEIIEWGKKWYVNADFLTADMAGVRICDLKLRIGYPYLYQHQADCQHLLVFTEVRLMRPDEPLESSKYPYNLSINQFYATMCTLCKRNYSKYLVTDCERLTARLNFLCRGCLLSYNYKNDQKIGSFKLFPFFDANTILEPTVQQAKDNND